MLVKKTSPKLEMTKNSSWKQGSCLLLENAKGDSKADQISVEAVRVRQHGCVQSVMRMDCSRKNYFTVI